MLAINIQRCPDCRSAELKSMVAILARPVIERILIRLDLGPHPLAQASPSLRAGSAAGAGLRAVGAVLYASARHLF